MIRGPSETVSGAARALAKLRSAAGLSIAEMARALGMAESRYRHYEERYKRAFLPGELLAAVRGGLAGLAARDPATADALRQLLQLHGQAGNNLAEEPAQFADLPDRRRGGLRGRIEALARDLPRMGAGNAELPAEPPSVVISTDGHHVEIVARVDRSGLDRLIERLTAVRALLD